ncbi:DoxX family protein [Allomuricauda ruestringensis DSM 13258]|uniref:DoxX family protein n=1 Tax=Allomuricauda ruestringensis (strain DSM 13258 / CIP 107369 / LMG 19739 / B1) TaxID=886377 RepID=G2PRV8_ALLRU|nr:DoxX family membrane protein [Allomuricauda ruestringensis]AEM69753.1 DoxX family protein [Allomuricauda ruestringensis DSM 13258]
MNSKVFLVVRILLGLLVLVFGLNKFLNFLPAGGEMPEAVMNYFGALSSTYTLKLVAVVEVLTGLALIFNKYGALMALILMSVAVNAVLFHITLSPDGLPPALALLILNIAVLYGYKDRYKELLRA